jgi:hypothetical protein
MFTIFNFWITVKNNQCTQDMLEPFSYSIGDEVPTSSRVDRPNAVLDINGKVILGSLFYDDFSQE